MRRIVALCAIAMLAVFGLVGCGSSEPAASETGAPHRASVTALASSSPSASMSARVPARVVATLARIDEGTWPPDDGSGTQGGRRFGNFEGRLPKTDSRGAKAKYTEWDVNIKRSGRGRDAERIITGADGSAWYTLDHYKSFARIR